MRDIDSEIDDFCLFYKKDSSSCDEESFYDEFYDVPTPQTIGDEHFEPMGFNERIESLKKEEKHRVSFQ